MAVGSYYRRFIQNYARRAEPLQHLIFQGVKFTWGEEKQAAFEDTKQAITQEILKKHSDSTQPFLIDRDALIIGPGAALHQRDAQGKEYPVAFSSRR